MKLPSLFKLTTTWLRRHAPDRAASVSLPAIFLFSFFCIQLHAAEPADPSIKLREQLKSVMLQLRTSQIDAANALAAQTAAVLKSKELATKIADLEKRNKSLTTQAAADKTATDATIAALNTKLADREKRLVLFTESNEKWQAGYAKAAEMARTKEDERAKLAAEIIVHQRTIADRERKNITLFNTANEILDRYQNYALGKALAAREPFIGTTRVKVENQVQGYKDKILDNRIAAPKAN